MSEQRKVRLFLDANILFAAAIACQADLLVTGDRRDFGPLCNQPQLTGGVRVVSVQELFA